MAGHRRNRPEPFHRLTSLPIPVASGPWTVAVLSSKVRDKMGTADCLRARVFGEPPRDEVRVRAGG